MVGGIRRKVSQGAYWVGHRLAPNEPVVEGALKPLTPAFDPAQHEVYIGYLNDAVTQPKVRNIALTGRYGAGKSSILERFAAQDHMSERVLHLALSSLGPVDEPESGDSPSAGKSSITNRIQKELVKQLLHREKPSKLKQSRYQRIVVLPRWRPAFEFVIALAVVAALLWSLGRFPQISASDKAQSLVWQVGTAFSAVVLVGYLYSWVRKAAHNKFSISEVSTAGTTIALARTSSYFDEYLDEIVYFFEVNRRLDTVIFEDLDRFNDPGIFESLRELNGLLNNTRQIGSRNIRFIYALRDSVFELADPERKQSGQTADQPEGEEAARTKSPPDPVRADSERANRTKFFDLVIPVVPFISHRNARDLLSRLLSDAGLEKSAEVSPALVDLVARHVPDMRLLTNIRNEYVVFSQRLMDGDTGVSWLEADKLFALIVYKNTHLSDFEAMLLGQGQLDQLYLETRALVASSTAVRRARLSRLARKGAHPDRLEAAARDMGKGLERIASAMAKAQGQISGRAERQVTAYVVGGTEFDPGRIGDVEFWDCVVELASPVDVRFGGAQLRIELSDLGVQVGVELTEAGWGKKRRSTLSQEQDLLTTQVNGLRTADFYELSNDRSLTTSTGAEGEGFDGLLLRTVKSELGRGLVSGGYIDRYYALYITQYYGEHLPANAMNFIAQNVDQGRFDATYELTSEEVAAVLAEAGGSFLKTRSAYNTAILDYLLGRDDDRASSILNSATDAYGDDEIAFFESYFNEGRHGERAAMLLGRSWAGAVSLLTSGIELPPDARLRFVNAALCAGPRALEIQLNDDDRVYLQENCERFPAVDRAGGSASDPVVDEGPAAAGVGREGEVKNPTARIPESEMVGEFSDAQVDALVRTLAAAGVVFVDLTGLTDSALRAVVESDRYVITAENFVAIVGPGVSLSLDSLRTANSGLYDDCLERIDEYLRVLFPTDSGENDDAGPNDPAVESEGVDGHQLWTIANHEAFAAIVNELCDCRDDFPARLLEVAHPNCRVTDIDTVPLESWQALVQASRIDLTPYNLDRYLAEMGEVDQALATALIATGPHYGLEVDDASGDGADTITRVASAILRASDSVPDPAVRVALAASLGLGEWFSIDELVREPGELLGHLVAAEIWPNNEEGLVRHFAPFKWPTLEFAIVSSKQFERYVDAEILSRANAVRALESDLVPRKVKVAVLNLFDDVLDITSADSMLIAGRTAVEIGMRLDLSQIEQIATVAGDTDLTVSLLSEASETLSGSEILRVLMVTPDNRFQSLISSGAVVWFERNDAVERLLERLKSQGGIKFLRKRANKKLPARFEVTVQ